MIQKSTSSEVFDAFTKTMNKYNIKKKANWVTSVIDTMHDSAKPLVEVLSDMGKTTDEFIIDSVKAGIPPNEIAKLVPNSSVQQITEIAAKAVPTVVDTAAGIADASKASGELSNLLTQSSQAIVTSGKEVLNLFAQSKDLAGKNADEIIELYEGLKRSRNSLKGAVTKLKNDLAKAQESVQISAEELAKKNHAISQGELVLKQSETQVDNLAKKITELGGQLDNAGNVIKGLEDQLTSTKDELSLAQKTIADLSQQGIALAAENKRLLDSVLEKAELAGYYKALHEALQQSGQSNTVAGQAASIAASQAQSQSAKAVQQIAQKTPAAAPIVQQAAATAKSNGAAKATKAINPAAAPTPTVTPQTKAPTQSGAPTPTVQPSTNAPTTGPSTPTKTPGNTAPTQTPPTPSPNPAPSPAPNPSKGKNAPTTPSPAPTPSVKPAKAPKPITFKDRLQNLILMGQIGSSVAAPIISVLPYVAILGLGGAGAYYIWKNYLQGNRAAISEDINVTVQSEYDAINSLKTLRFNKGSHGAELTQNLIDNLSSSIPYVSKLNDPEISEEELKRTAEGLDHLAESIDTYIQERETIAKDLIDPDGFDQAIASLETLKSNSQKIKQHLYNSISSTELTKDESSIPERGITAPQARPAPLAEESTSKKPGHIPSLIPIHGEMVDIGNLSPGMRNAAPQIAELLKSPEGLAFIDPDRVWGGWLPQTPITSEDGQVIQDKKSDYLRALKFLYLNKIFNRQDLRQFIRQNLQRTGKKRMTGWNNAIKYYNEQRNVTANQENNKNFTQKFAKPANNDTSSVIYDNRIVLNMRKKADQFSKEYYQEAVSGLEDQYAKSYYAGLKGMYDQKLSKSEADYVSLYEVHKETGNDLIGSAHPETIDLADAMGNGGIVENQIEQQRHNRGVAQSMPTGNFRNRNAWIIQSLVKLADQVDEQGLKEASDLIDAALRELTS